ncbi:leucine-rich repeat domain-containing protein [Coleofasciculus sp.]|uniref:leucine-rich repeat domain-containing protein n=1 Tax=Coleofasciculus sp. TaxID=3100458 RepID=UPI003A26400B
MDKTAVIALTISTWILGWEVAQAANPSLGSSFKEWCLNKTSLSAEARKTVEVLLEEAGTSDCKQADENLSSRTELFLYDNKITDVSPLSGLTNLTVLYLHYNQITDVSALSGLTNLRRLNLSSNQITDISPLSGLTNLTGLDLSSNKIIDITPLSGLTNLRRLGLIQNQITDVRSLSGLTNLTLLDLRDNPIPQQTCPVSSPDVCVF